MKFYVISDTHFNHDNVIDFCERPQQHERLILKNLMFIGKGNCLIHLGDFALGNESKYCQTLSNHWVGKKIIVLGNHDSKSYSWYMENGWDFACEKFMLKYCGKKVMFSHKPQPWDGEWDINVHGHLHNLGHRDHEHKLYPWHRLYSPELRGYKPVELSKLLQETNTERLRGNR